MTGQYPVELPQQARNLVEAATGTTVLRLIPVSAGRMTYKFQVIVATGDNFILRVYPRDRAVVAR